jgi:c-di-GMP-binding flagellar brake protein YcgR
MNNRRGTERKAHREPVSIRSLTTQATVKGQAIDLSEGGALVRLDGPIGHNPSLVVLDLTLGGGVTRLHAVVQRTEEFRGKTQLGLRFVYLGERERLALRSHLRLANSSPAT